MTNYNELSKEVHDEIKSILGAYSSCRVIYMNGKFEVMTATFLLKHYPDDFKYIGDYYKEDILTKEERIEAYANNFHSYSNEYEGKRSYTIFANCTYQDRFKIIDGELRKIS